LEALHSADIGDISFAFEILVRAVTKFLQIFHLIFLVSLQIECSSDRLRAAHGARLVHDEDNRDVLLAHDLLVLDLGSCLNDVVDGLGRWLLTIIDTDIVGCIAELAAPDLLLVILDNLIVLLGLELLLLNFTVNVEDSIALFAENGVTCGDFRVVF
jgi:hypothetical protein